MTKESLVMIIGLVVSVGVVALAIAGISEELGLIGH